MTSCDLVQHDRQRPARPRLIIRPRTGARRTCYPRAGHLLTRPGSTRNSRRPAVRRPSAQASPRSGPAAPSPGWSYARRAHLGPADPAPVISTSSAPTAASYRPAPPGPPRRTPPPLAHRHPRRALAPRPPRAGEKGGKRRGGHTQPRSAQLVQHRGRFRQWQAGSSMTTCAVSTAGPSHEAGVAGRHCVHVRPSEIGRDVGPGRRPWGFFHQHADGLAQQLPVRAGSASRSAARRPRPLGSSRQRDTAARITRRPSRARRLTASSRAPGN